MSISNPLDILLAHNHWANRQLIETCAKLTPEQFHQKFEMGAGSVHDTAMHILGAMRGWGDVLASREHHSLPDGTRRSVEEFLVMLDELSADLATSARAHPLDETITVSRGGKSYTFIRGVVLTHVTTHGVHHRAQCLNMLRHLGVSPGPKSSVLEWTLSAEGK